MVHDLRDGALSEQHDNALLEDLDLRCRADVSNVRNLTSHRSKVGVTIRSANVAERDMSPRLAQTTELRRNSMACMGSQPLMVGNVFHLTFDNKHFAVPPVLAVCDRCSMLGELSFELRFQFVREIDLPMPTSNPPPT